MFVDRNSDSCSIVKRLLNLPLVTSIPVVHTGYFQANDKLIHTDDTIVKAVEQPKHLAEEASRTRQAGASRCCDAAACYALAGSFEAMSESLASFRYSDADSAFIFLPVVS